MKLTELLLARAYVARDDKGAKTVSFKDKWQTESRKLSEQEIVSHLKEKNGAIALLTGKGNGITVIDFDDTNNPLLIELAEVCPTYCVQTYKGFHFYYRYTPELQTGSNRFGQGVDVRNDGGVVFCPPTPHYSRWGDEKIAELNPEAKELLNQYVTSEPTSPSLKATTSRNDTLFRKARGWIEHYTPEEVWSRMVKANKEFTKGELDDRELETMYQQVLKYKASGQVAKTKEIQKQNVINTEKRFTWGTQNLNYNFAIIKETDFIVIGAKRSSGKTIFSIFMAMKNAIMGHKVLYLSLEMDTEMILDDIGRKYSGITIEEEFENTIPEIKKRAYERKKNEIKSIENLILKGIRRNSNITWNTVKEVIKEENADIIFIDNLDLIQDEKEKNNNDRQAKITREMMSYSSENHTPIILIHHYRKAGKEDRGMDELSGSGKIADNADRIVTLKKAGAIGDPYPINCQTEISLIKGRGYPENTQTIFFIKGSFVDTAPPMSEQKILEQGIYEEDALKIFKEFMV
jgi:hypothetical protein